MADIPQVYRDRLAQVAEWLREEEADALFLFGLGSTIGPSSKSHGYMSFLCDWDSHHHPSILVVRPGQEPVLFVANVFSTFYARQYHWLTDVRLAPAPDLGRRAAELYGEASGPGRRLALIGRNEMPAPVWEALNAGLPGTTWIDLSGHIDRERVVKSEAELRKHEEAARVCDAMFETLQREVRQPRPTFQLQAEMERTARCAGCEYCMTWLTVGPEADYSRFFKEECRRVPTTGDQMIAGIYLMLDGFWGHAIRTGSIGPATPAQLKAYGIAREMQDDMLAELHVGNDLNLVQAAADHVLQEHFSDAEIGAIFRFRHAHGLGYSYEDPITTTPFPQPYGAASPSPPLPARAGMLFELHPNLFVPGLGGACLGDMVGVTSTVPRFLTHFPRAHLDWAG